MSRERFVEWVTEAILQLPSDMKAMLRIVEDPELSDESRVAAAGALLHVLSQHNSIPGTRGVLSYVGHVLVMRLVLERIRKDCPDAMARHAEESPELLGQLDEELGVTREYLGDSVRVLEKAAENVSKLKHEGHSAKECVFDTEASNWLYDTVQEAIVEQLEFDEDEVARETKRIDSIKPSLETRAQSLK